MVRIHLTRVAILITLFAVGILSLFAMPMDDSLTWYSDLFISKAIAAVCLWVFGNLYNRWKKTDRWIRAYDKWCEKQC